jgi:hypothetical protein
VAYLAAMSSSYWAILAFRAISMRLFSYTATNENMEQVSEQVTSSWERTHEYTHIKSNESDCFL